MIDGQHGDRTFFFASVFKSIFVVVGGKPEDDDDPFRNTGMIGRKPDVKPVTHDSQDHIPLSSRQRMPLSIPIHILFFFTSDPSFQ